MKKLVLTTVLAGVSTLATAQSGLYIQGDVGYSKLQYADDGLTGVKTRDNGVKGTIAVGKDTGDLRYQADVTLYNDASGSGRVFNSQPVSVNYQVTTSTGRVLTGTAEGKVLSKSTNVKEVQSVGVSAIYDFETTNPMITPYVGTRVGVNRIKVQTQNVAVADIKIPADPSDPNSTETTMQQVFTENKTKKKDKLGLGVSAGVQFNLNNTFAIDTGVEYNHLGKVDGIKGDQFGAKVGARMSF